MTDARSAGANPGARGDRPGSGRHGPDGPGPVRHPGARGGDPGSGPPGSTGPEPVRHPVRAFFRANPQVLVLLIICIVLGLGTFIAVLFGLVTAPTDQTTGEPSGAILGVHATLSGARWLAL